MNNVTGINRRRIVRSAAAGIGLVSWAAGATSAEPPARPMVPDPPPTHTLQATPPETKRIGTLGSDWRLSPLNAIASVSERGVGQTRETWIATADGVKCVDRRRGIMRHYTVRDGLPGNNIAAIYADRDGVWCLASVSGSIALCTLEEAADRWRVLQSFPATPSATGNGGWENEGDRSARVSARTLIAASPRRVAFATEAVSYRETAVVHLLDKKTGKVTDIPWDPALRADNNILAPTALVIQSDDTLWLGTNLGLLRWNETERRWKRFLPDRYIDAITLGSDNSLWAAVHPRSSRQGMPNPGVPIWTLIRVSTIDGRTREWLPPANDTLASSEKVTAVDSKGNKFTFPPRGTADNLRDSIPGAISVASDGAIWTSHVSRNSLDNDISISFSSFPIAGASGGFERFDANTEKWTAFPMRMVGKPGARHAVVGTGDEGVMPLNQLPDEAVRPLATAIVPYSLYGFPRSRSNLFWVGQLYPEWICPE